MLWRKEQKIEGVWDWLKKLQPPRISFEEKYFVTSVMSKQMFSFQNAYQIIRTINQNRAGKEKYLH